MSKDIFSPLEPHLIREIFKRFHHENKHPKSELIYHDHFTLLIAVVLSAQTTDKRVNEVTKNLFAYAKTPEQFLDLGEEKLFQFIKSIGLARSKAKHIILLCKKLVEEFSSTVPNQSIQLQSLPGVGQKTANVILNVAFHQPTIAVDTHIFRVSQRLHLAKGTTPLHIEKQLETIIPDEYRLHAHHWLILHGRYICTARQPKCNICLLKDICPSKDDFTKKTPPLP